MHFPINAAKIILGVGVLAAGASFCGGVAAEAGTHPTTPSAEQQRADLAAYRELQRQLDNRITVDMQNAGLVDAINLIRTKTALPIILDPRVAATIQVLVTLKADDQCLRVVLDDLIQQGGLHYLLDRQSIYLSAQPIPARAGDRQADHGLESGLSKRLDQPITIDLQNAGFEDVIQDLRRQGGIIIVLTPEVAARHHPRVTVKADGQRLRDVLADVTRQIGAYYLVLNQALCVLAD